MRKTLAIVIGVAAAGVLLSGCGGDKKRDDGAAATVVDYSALKPTPQTEQALQWVAGSDLDLHIKNGLRLKVASNSNNRVFVDVLAVPTAAPAAQNEAAGAATSGSDNFSQTNVHVAGVDEADFAKYDGSHWFVAAYPEYEPYRKDNYPTINVVATDPSTPNAEVVAQIPLENQWGGVSEMYLVADANGTSHVAALQNQWGNVYPMLPGIGFPMMAVAVSEPMMARPAIVSDALYLPYPVNSQVKVQLFDVAQASAPFEDWSLSIDGSLIDSRKVDNILYLVTRFDPWLAQLQFEYASANARLGNESVLGDASLEELMPHYHVDDRDEGALSAGCYLQKGTQPFNGYTSLVNITAIDLSLKKMVSSRCINSAVEGLSMTRNALYLTGTVFDAQGQREQTVIHKFALSNAGATYKATGHVKGYIGQSADPAFKLHEHEGDLRVVTSSGNSWDGTISHHLTVLEDKGVSLETIASLPNSAHPEPIGKPGEDIYAVRFEGDKGYIVTFRRTDPLYALDLSNRIDPKISGELEVPGFATYMHPVNENYLFAIGQNADENGSVTGMKVALLDVSGAAPKEVSTLLLGTSGTYSEALNNLRAITFLPVGNDTLRIAMPINLHQSTGASQWGNWQYTGLELFELTGIAGANATLVHTGTVVAEQASAEQPYSRGTGNDRGILHGDAVFYAHANGIWAANWATPKMVVGPIVPPPAVCTKELRAGLAVTVNAPGGNACAATVSAVTSGSVELLTAQGSGQSCVFTGAYEQVGEYYIEAKLAGFSAESANVTVLKDECHVMTEKPVISLVSYQDGCPEILAPPSVEVIVDAYTASDACEAKVEVVQGDARHLLTAYPAPTESIEPVNTFDGASIAWRGSQCIYRGANGVSGEVDIVAELKGYPAVIRKSRFIKAKDACRVAPIQEHIGFY